MGAGLTGSVIARELADHGLPVTVIDEREHIAGNCWCQRNPHTGILVHAYGPHIFHTSDEKIWEYVNRYAEFRPYLHRVKASIEGRICSLPINLLTINQFFDKSFTPLEAQKFLENVLAEPGITAPVSLEDQALRSVGRDLYEAFFKGYTIKQWGMHPRDLPASILKRLPVRFSFDDNYFSDAYQGIPTKGYTELVQNILSSSNIQLKLNTRYKSNDVEKYNHVFYSGRIDRYFDYKFGQLPYRTLKFEHFYPAEHLDGDFQGCAQMNFCDKEVPYTRIIEHKHLAPWEKHENTITTREFSQACGQNDIPFYPVLHAGGSDILDQYIAESKKQIRTTFVGRLGTHQYLDMDVAVSRALLEAHRFLKTL